MYGKKPLQYCKVISLQLIKMNKKEKKKKNREREDSWESPGLQGDETRSNQIKTKGNQSWIFSGRTDAEAEAAILWPPNAKN